MVQRGGVGQKAHAVGQETLFAAENDDARVPRSTSGLAIGLKSLTLWNMRWIRS